LRLGRAIWPESRAWHGRGTAITPEPSLRSSMALSRQKNDVAPLPFRRGRRYDAAGRDGNGRKNFARHRE
jgi:hypothetical protein